MPSDAASPEQTVLDTPLSCANNWVDVLRADSEIKQLGLSEDRFDRLVQRMTSQEDFLREREETLQKLSISLEETRAAKAEADNRVRQQEVARNNLSKHHVEMEELAKEAEEMADTRRKEAEERRTETLAELQEATRKAEEAARIAEEARKRLETAHQEEDARLREELERLESYRTAAREKLEQAQQAHEAADRDHARALLAHNDATRNLNEVEKTCSLWVKEDGTALREKFLAVKKAAQEEIEQARLRAKEKLEEQIRRAKEIEAAIEQARAESESLESEEALWEARSFEDAVAQDENDNATEAGDACEDAETTSSETSMVGSEEVVPGGNAETPEDILAEARQGSLFEKTGDAVETMVTADIAETPKADEVAPEVSEGVSDEEEANIALSDSDRLPEALEGDNGDTEQSVSLESVPMNQVADAVAGAYAEDDADTALSETAVFDAENDMLARNIDTRHMKVYRGRLRSGQILRHRGDVVVLGQVHPGAEIIATGHVLVYGTMAGKVAVGAAGDRSARLYAEALDPDMVSIAGCYHVFDAPPDIDEDSPAVVCLDAQGVLQITQLENMPPCPVAEETGKVENKEATKETDVLAA